VPEFCAPTQALDRSRAGAIHEQHRASRGFRGGADRRAREHARELGDLVGGGPCGRVVIRGECDLDLRGEQPRPREVVPAGLGERGADGRLRASGIALCQ
jgi:hypothetical protein